MQFTDADLDVMLAATGQPVTVMLNGVAVKTIQAKFREDYLAVDPFESHVGIMKPAMTCKISDLAGVTNANSFMINSTEYKFDGKPENKPSGLSLVHLGVKL